MKKKSREEYLERKKLKQEAKAKESGHKIDYTSIPDKSYTTSRGFMSADPITEALLLSAMIRARKRNRMWGIPQEKETKE